jgi:hypothetical protein
MGRFLGSWDIDDIVRVHIQTSSVTTGAATDADAAPTWRVYEDDTATPVTTGSFTTLNSQVGFYVAAITLAAAIGYEVGKSYGIRTQATVGGVIGADVHSFQIQSEVRLAAGAITAGTITAGALQGFTLGSVAGTVGSVAAAVTVGATSHAAIVDAVWAETAAGYTTAGSMGYQLAQADSLGALVNAIWDEPKANHTTADTYGEFLDATVSGIGAAGAVTVGATSVAVIAAAVWDETGSSHTSAGSFGARLNVTINSMTAGAIGAVTVGATSQAAISAAVTAGSIGAVTVGSTSTSAIQNGLATAAALDTVDNFLDTEIAAIKAKTDLLFAGTGNSIAADIRYVNGVSITGNGQSGTEWGPGS